VLVVLGLGGVVAVATAGVPTPTVPTPAVFPAGSPSFSAAALEGTVAQLGMTVGNAAIATALLCGDLYDRDISPDALSSSMGVTCLAAIPLGGVPMCHGAGAWPENTPSAREPAARTSCSGSAISRSRWSPPGAVLAAFPMAVLGVLLVVVALELARAAFEPVTDGRSLALVAGIGAVGLVGNVGVAFVLGAVAFWLLSRQS